MSKNLVVSILAVALLAACGGGGGDANNGGTQPAGGALATAQPGELTQRVQAMLREREKRYAENPGHPGAGGDVIPISALPALGFSAAPARSSTLVQESGVDEADLLASDGNHLYSLAAFDAGKRVRVQSHRRASDGSIAPRGTLDIPADDAQSLTAQGMVLTDDARSLAVLTHRWLPVSEAESCAGGCPVASSLPFGPIWMLSSVGVQHVVLEDGVPKAGTRVAIDGQLVDSRRIGNRLYVVTTHRPRLPIDAIPFSAPAAEREAVIAALKADDLLPRIRVNHGPARPLLAETDCFVEPGNASLAVEFTTVTVFDLASAELARTSRCVAGGSEALYMTPSSLYLATTRWAYTTGPRGWSFPVDMRTDIHKFALERSAVAYRGSADVAGHLGWNSERKSHRFSEHEGVLRVLTFTGSTGWMFESDASSPSAPPPSPATLTLLREKSGEARLETVATLPNARRPAALGKPGEQVYAVRFAGTRGYVVTFRVIDPLYVLDLADAADPRVAGELELPGFSDWLIPVSERLLFGVGRDVAGSGRRDGVKVALLDVSDPAAPRQLATRSFGDVYAQSGLEYSRHGLNLLAQGSVTRLAMPLALADGNGASWRNGLARFEVDTTAATLKNLPWLGEQAGTLYPDLATQRSVLIGDHAYYLRSGELTAHAW